MGYDIEKSFRVAVIVTMLGLLNSACTPLAAIPTAGKSNSLSSLASSSVVEAPQTCDEDGNCSCDLPSVNVGVPADGQHIIGQVVVTVTADAGTLTQLSINSNTGYVMTVPASAFQENGDQYSYVWDTTAGPDASDYRIEASATNTCGTSTQAHQVSVVNPAPQQNPPPAQPPAQPVAPAPVVPNTDPSCMIPDPVNGANQVRIYRFWKGGDRMITSSLQEGCGAGYTRESSFLFYQSPVGSMSAIYRCWAPGTHFFSALANCEGFTTESLLGYLATSQIPGSRPVYRLWNRNDGDHLMSYLPDEGASVGFIFESTVGYGPQ